MQDELYYKLNGDNKPDKAINIFVIIVLVLLALVIFYKATYFHVEIQGSSMENTLQNEDVILVNRFRSAKRGDIVIIADKKINSSGNSISSELIIKRVIATEGDSIYFQNGFVYLKKSGEEKFTKIEEDYIKHYGATFYPDATSVEDNRKSPTFEIGAGEYFFLGDNRMGSKDSRSADFGTCTKEQIKGVVTDFCLATKPLTTGIYGKSN